MEKETWSGNLMQQLRSAKLRHCLYSRIFFENPQVLGTILQNVLIEVRYQMLLSKKDRAERMDEIKTIIGRLKTYAKKPLDILK
jgi:hypothetical protein